MHRPRAEAGDAIVHFLGLLGGMDMHRAGGEDRGDLAQLLRRDRTQRMRCDPDRRTRQLRHDLARALHQGHEAVGRIDEADLSGIGRGAAKAAIRIKRRQQGQADPGCGARRSNARGHLADIGIGPAGRIVMQIVEFADGRESRLQHLDIGVGRNRLDIVRRELRQKPVHHLAPGPEAVTCGTAPLAKPGHALLERVAMQVRHPWKGDAGHRARRRPARLPGVTRDNQSVAADLDADVIRPALWQKGFFELICAQNGLARHAVSDIYIVIWGCVRNTAAPDRSQEAHAFRHNLARRPDCHPLPAARRAR